VAFIYLDPYTKAGRTPPFAGDFGQAPEEEEYETTPVAATPKPSQPPAPTDSTKSLSRTAQAMTAAEQARKKRRDYEESFVKQYQGDKPGKLRTALGYLAAAGVAIGSNPRWNPNGVQTGVELGDSILHPGRRGAVNDYKLRRPMLDAEVEAADKAVDDARMADQAETAASKAESEIAMNNQKRSYYKTREGQLGQQKPPTPPSTYEQQLLREYNDPAKTPEEKAAIKGQLEKLHAKNPPPPQRPGPYDEETIAKRVKVADAQGLKGRDRQVFIATGRIERPPAPDRTSASDRRLDRSQQVTAKLGEAQAAAAEFGGDMNKAIAKVAGDDPALRIELENAHADYQVRQNRAKGNGKKGDAISRITAALNNKAASTPSPTGSGSAAPVVKKRKVFNPATGQIEEK
jgi:hypothetical protein